MLIKIKCPINFNCMSCMEFVNLERDIRTQAVDFRVLKKEILLTKGNNCFKHYLFFFFLKDQNKFETNTNKDD